MKAIIGATVLSLFVAACSAEGDELTGSRGPSRANNGQEEGTENGPTPIGDPTQPGTCKEGVAHAGFAGTDFVADRKPGAIGADRRRVKPYSAMRSEFQRALGVVPSALTSSSAAYGDVPNRWFSEPTAGAVSLYTTYSLAFTGCFDTMSAPAYEQAPTAESATAECARMQRKFWQRSATPDETKACVDFALGLTTETVARRRWAHVCASVMTSTGFTTY